MPANQGLQKIRVFPVSLGITPEYSSPFTHGMLLSHAKAYKDGILNNYCHFDKITPFTLEDADRILSTLEADNLPTVFVLSSYVWNHEHNLAFARQVHETMGNALTIIGGPNIPRNEKPCTELMNANPAIDVVGRGEGEATLAEVLETVALQYAREQHNIRWSDLAAVTGVTYRTRDMQLIRTPERERISNLDTIPSPYLTGEYEHMPEIFGVAVIESNRGCPYGCTFCDWGGATLSKIYKFDLQRIFDDIEYVGRKKIPTILFADANFGVFERDIAIAEKLVETKKKYGYPTTSMHFTAKNSSERVSRIIRILHSENMMNDISAALQTTDPVVLENVHRSNIKESAYIKLIETYDELGLMASTDLLIGLPGQNYASLQRDLQFCFNRKIIARTFLVTILPNSPMSNEDYIEKHQIVVDETGHVESTYSFDLAERNRMLLLKTAYSFFVEEKIIKYLLIYLQMEHGVKSLDLIDKLLVLSDTDDETPYPFLAWARKNILDNKFVWMGALAMKWGPDAKNLFAHTAEFLHEIVSIAESEFSIKTNPDEINNIIKLQQSTLPQPGRKPTAVEVSLEYDFFAYLEQLGFGKLGNLASTPESFKPLAAYKKNNILKIPDQRGLRRKVFAYSKTDMSPAWPLDIGLQI